METDEQLIKTIVTKLPEYSKDDRSNLRWLAQQAALRLYTQNGRNVSIEYSFNIINKLISAKEL